MRRLELIVSRLAWFVPTLAGLVAIVFLISNVIPTDPVRVLLGENATPQQIEAMRVKLGYDQPLWVQLGRHFRDVLSGNFGTSIFSQRPIWEDLAERLPATLELALVAITLAIALGIPLGVMSALRRNSWWDQAVRVLSVAGLAMAAFWLAMLLQFLFSMKLGTAPLNGRIDGFGPTPVTGFLIIDSLLDWDMDSLRSAMSHIALPALTLALPAAATIVRFTRAGVLDVINSNHVLYQRAMGLPPGLIVWKYVLRNALISTVTQIGLIFGVLVTNAVVVETVFDWPGIGTYAVQSILQSDHKAIIAFTIWIGALIVVVNLLVDIVHSFIDPRGSR
ncbi:MAG: ABC transporter permease [Alphaproteobacteria bacterium]|nr:ABC transporter permease [Alphaproteobacteria bacterium]